MAILLVALAARLGFAVASYVSTGSTAIFDEPDTSTYVRAAKLLIASGWQTPETDRTPVYPLALTPGLLSGHFHSWVLGLQCLASVPVVFLVYQCASNAFKCDEVGLIASGIYAVEPLSIFYSSQVLSETLFVMLLIGSLYFLIIYLNRGKIAAMCLSAILLALSTLTRPITCYLPIPLAALVLLFVWRKTRAPGRAILFGSVFVILSSGPVVLWQFRNRAFGDYNGISSIKAYNMYFQQAGYVLSSTGGIPYDTMRQKMGMTDWNAYLAAHPEQTNWSMGKRYEWMEERGSAIVLRNLGTYLPAHLRGVTQTMVKPDTPNYLRPFFPAGLVERRWVVIIASSILTGFLFFSYLGAAVGNVTSPSARTRVLLMVGVAMYLAILSGMPEGSSRFRHPIMPLISMLAGNGLWSIWNRIIRRKTHCPQA